MKKRPKFRCAWALACTIAALPAAPLYLAFKYLAKAVVTGPRRRILPSRILRMLRVSIALKQHKPSGQKLPKKYKEAPWFGITEDDIMFIAEVHTDVPVKEVILKK